MIKKENRPFAIAILCTLFIFDFLAGYFIIGSITLVVTILLSIGYWQEYQKDKNINPPDSEV